MWPIKRVWISILVLTTTIQWGYAQLSPGQQALQQKLNTLIERELQTSLETTQMSLSVYDLTTQTSIYSYRPRQRLRPASIEKVVTSVAALHYLGADYALKTRLCYTGGVVDGILEGDLYAVGGFDPCFSDEDMVGFIEKLKAMGIDSIAGRICADLSFKEELKWGHGWCWDDEMPTLSPLLINGIDDFMPRFIETLQRENIRCEGAYWNGELPLEAIELAIATTPIGEVLIPVMKESDNLYAESLFYQLASLSGMPYAGADEARSVICELVGQLGLDPKLYTFADGSGVSLYNYLTVELQVELLRYAHSQPSIFNLLIESFPIAGVDGTLRRRMVKTKAAGRVRAKTGSVNGVSTLSGYVTAPNGNLLAFCIMNQGVVRGAIGRDFQDKVCAILCGE